MVAFHDVPSPTGKGEAAMTDVEQRIQCRWCHAQSPSSARTCDRCGAPLDVHDVVTDSGWRQAPRLRDLTEFHWASSTCQLDAGVVPVVEITLNPADSVFFEHHTMLWKDETVPMAVMNTPGGAKRLLSGMPFVLSVARGPGRVAFSRDAPGEIIVIPVEAPREVDVREHALLLASATLTYSFEKLPGLRAMLVANTGMYLDRYVAQSAPGLLVLHGYGNVFERTLGEGETILVEPGGFLYKDSSVTMELTSVNFKGSGTGTTPPAAGAGRGGCRRCRRSRARRPTGPVRSWPQGPHGGQIGAERRGPGLGGGQPAFRWRPPRGGLQLGRGRRFDADAPEGARAAGRPVDVPAAQERMRGRP